MMVKNQISLLMVSSAFFLVACDTKDRTALPGTRETYLTAESSIIPDPKGRGRIIVLPGTASLSPALKEIASVQIGEGDSKSQRMLMEPLVISKGSQQFVYTIDAVGKVSATVLTKTSTDLSSDQIEVKSLWTYNSLADSSLTEALGGGLCIEGDRLYITTGAGEIHALDASCGKLLWKKDGFAPFRSPATVHESFVIALSNMNEVIAFDKNTGDKIWSHTGLPEVTQLLMCVSPVKAFDTIIIAYSSGEIHALNSKNGVSLWSDIISPVIRADTVTGIPHVAATPVVDGGHIFVISHGGRMAALDVKTGARLWQKEIGGTQPPAVSQNFLFVLSNIGELACLDRHNGDVIWVKKLHENTSKDNPLPVFQGPIIDGNSLLVTSSNGQLLSLNALNGNVISKTSLDASVYLKPVLFDKKLYILTSNAILHVFN